MLLNRAMPACVKSLRTNMRCSHVQWLELEGVDNGWALINPCRIDRILGELDMSAGTPLTTVLFMGRQQKSKIVKAMFPSNNFSRRRGHGLANLFLDYTSTSQELLIADCTLGAAAANQFGHWTACHESYRYRVHTDHGILQRPLRTMVLSNLLRPFCATVCVFLDDFGGSSSCYDFLLSLLDSQVECAYNALSTLIIIGDVHRSDLGLAKLLKHHRFSKTFDSVQLVPLEEDSEPRPIPLIVRQLKDSITNARSRLAREALLFDAVEISKLFQKAHEAFCTSPGVASDLLALYGHPLSVFNHKLFCDAVHDLLQIEEFSSLSSETLLNLIVLSMLYESYPVDCHRKNYEKQNDLLLC